MTLTPEQLAEARAMAVDALEDDKLSGRDWLDMAERERHVREPALARSVLALVESAERLIEIEQPYLRLSREVSATVLRQDERIDALREGLRLALRWLEPSTGIDDPRWRSGGMTVSELVPRFTEVGGAKLVDAVAALRQLLEGK